MKTWCAALCVLAVGCGGGGGGDDDAVVIPDASVDAPPDAAPTTVEIRTFDTPLFIRYRDGAGAWKVPTEIEAGLYEIGVTGRYEVVSVCGSEAAGFETQVVRATPSDGTQQFAFCFYPDGGPPPPQYQVTGQMVQAGTVALGDGDTSETGPWTFDVMAPMGTNDLIAYDATRVMLRRDLDITANTTAMPIDLTTQGVPFRSVEHTLNGVETDEIVTADVYFSTFFGGATFSRTGTTATLMPQTLVTQNDFQYVAVGAGTAGTYRYINYFDTVPATTTFTLLPRLSNVTFTAESATWTTLPEGDASLYVSDNSGNVLRVDATQAWLGTATSLAADLALDGYDAAWKLDAADQYRGLSVTQYIAGVGHTTSIAEVTGTMTRATRPRSVRVSSEAARQRNRVRSAR